jgi:hypothetical protein
LRTVEMSSRAELANLFSDVNDRSKRALLKFSPRGWLYQCMVSHARLNEKFSAGFDATNQIVWPGKIEAAGQELLASVEHPSAYTFLSSWITPNWMKAMQKFAANQTMANEGAVACALERYHLLRGEYPEALDALRPQFIDKLPHDLVGGQPLKYRRSDRHFLLYSIGWNQTDDDGVPGKSIAEGDWVWGQSPQ